MAKARLAFLVRPRSRTLAKPLRRLSVRNGGSTLERTLDFRLLVALSTSVSGRFFVGAFIGEILYLRRSALKPFPLYLAPVGAIVVDSGFCTMQKIRHFMAVMSIRRRVARVMNQPRIAVRSDVQLHAEVPRVALLGLVHIRITALGLSRFLAEGGAAIRVASTIVPPESLIPLAMSNSPTLAKSAAPR